MYVCVSMTAAVFQLNLQPHAGNERLYLKTSTEWERENTVNSLQSRHASVMLSAELWDWTPKAWRHQGHTICIWRQSRADSSVHAERNERIAGACEIASHFQDEVLCRVIPLLSADVPEHRRVLVRDVASAGRVLPLGNRWVTRALTWWSQYSFQCVLYNISWCYLTRCRVLHWLRVSCFTW